jgi:hypothetical protein
MSDAPALPVRDHQVTTEAAAGPHLLAVQPAPSLPEQAEAERVAKIERRLLAAIQWVIYSGVALLTICAGMLSWFHLINVAATNGHIAPGPLLFLFPAIIDGFMALSSAVIVRHALMDELGGRTWYAGALASGTAALSICLNIQDSTAVIIVPAWMLPGIAPALFMLGTELGLTELRLAMRKLRAQVGQAQPPVPSAPPAPSKKVVIRAALQEHNWKVVPTLAALEQRGVQVDKSYVYDIRRAEAPSLDATAAARSKQRPSA